MQPKLELLSSELVHRVIDEALQLLREPGIKVQSAAARDLLAEAGGQVDGARAVVRLPETAVRQALATVPREFCLYNLAGEAAVRYGGDHIHFDPGSAAVNVLDLETGHRPAVTADLVRLVQVAEMLPQFDAQSTAVVCSDVAQEIGDIYRLYLLLLYSAKPIVTGAFASRALQPMIDMLALYAGDRAALAQKPRAVFDVCPSPPLIWSEFGAESLIQLAQAQVPAEIVSMPLAGVAAPVTLIGAVVQHAAECLSGITIHQMARPGAPIVWGGAPAILDMRHGATPMGAIETAMIDVAYVQVGKSLGLPTHTYLGASDAKIVDGQAGLESGIGTVLAALAGINMISGAGMLDFLNTFSVEKLVIDAEIVAMARRLRQGIHLHTETLATAFFEGIEFKGDFLKQRATRQLFGKEQTLPSAVIDRGSIRSWQEAGKPDILVRAQSRVAELLAAYQPPSVPAAQTEALERMMATLAAGAGMDRLPTR
jgi:trimethylamine---corrinoid protein Co-methyltransferase